MDRGRGRGRGAYHSVAGNFSRSSLFPEEDGGRVMGRVSGTTTPEIIQYPFINSPPSPPFPGRALVRAQRNGTGRLGLWPAFDQSPEGV